MSTVIIIIGIIVFVTVVYKIISNNYKTRMSLINRGMEDLRTKDYAIIEIKPSLYLGTLKTEGYETYVSPVSQAFLLDSQEVLVMPTAKNHSFAIVLSKMDDISESKLETLIGDN